MNGVTANWTNCILMVSVGCLLIGGVLSIFVFRGRKKNCTRVPFERRAIWFMVALILAATLSRYATGRVDATINTEHKIKTWPEEVVSSFLGTMQSFTMDADYDTYCSDGKDAFTTLAGPKAAEMFIIYANVLNVLCAFSGGAILLSIMLKIFPSLKLLLLKICFWKPVYYISQLNSESIALAKSIRKNNGKHRWPILLFCGVDPDDDKVSAECADYARKLGAWMTEKSLADLTIHRGLFGKKIFLIGSDDENLAIVSGFADIDAKNKLRGKDEIYVFANEKYGTLVETAVRRSINLRLNGRNDNEEVDDKELKKKITLFTINRYRSMVYDLLVNKPLCSALKPDAKDLKIAIFGSGRIGTEMFLAAYWCGQMLDRELMITIVSDEKKDHFEKRIDHINDDILRTSKQKKDCELLRVYPKNCEHQKYNAPYFSYEYIESDVYLDGLTDILCKEKHDSTGNGRLADFDYFVITLGSDKKNMEVAERIARIISINCDKTRKVPIACAIWDDNVNEILKKRFQLTFAGVEVYPFASMKDSFDVERVLLESVKKRAERSKNAYERLIAQKQNNKEKLEEDSYTYWANAARAIHVHYKASGIVTRTSKTTDVDSCAEPYLQMCRYLSNIEPINNLLDGARKSKGVDVAFKKLKRKDKKQLRKLKEEADYFDQSKIVLDSLCASCTTNAGNCCRNKRSIAEYLGERKKYYDLIGGYIEGNNNMDAAIQALPKTHPYPVRFNELAWLEHRRWNAFMRTEGFRCPTDTELQNYLDTLPKEKDRREDGKPFNAGKHKSILHKIHPCLVECDKEGMHEGLIGEGMREGSIEDIGLPPKSEWSKYDMLDNVSMKLKAVEDKYKLDIYDFKKYDYPEYE